MNMIMYPSNSGNSHFVILSLCEALSIDDLSSGRVSHASGAEG